MRFCSWLTRSGRIGRGDWSASGGMLRSGAEVLHRPTRRFTQGGCRVERPIRIAQHLAGQEHQISLTLGYELVGLVWIGDHTHGCRWNAGLRSDSSRKGCLKAGSDGNAGIGNLSAGRSVDQVNAMRFEKARKLNRVVDGPAALDPICRGDADEEREVRRPLGADCVHNFEREAGAILKAAAVGVLAHIGERREELVNQVAVGRVNLDVVKSCSEGTARGKGKGVDDFGDSCLIEGLRYSITGEKMLRRLARRVASRLPREAPAAHLQRVATCLLCVLHAPIGFRHARPATG